MNWVGLQPIRPMVSDGLSLSQAFPPLVRSSFHLSLFHGRFPRDNRAPLHLLCQPPTPQQREREREMEAGRDSKGVTERGWNFRPNDAAVRAGKLTIRRTLEKVMGNLSSGNAKTPTIHLGLGDPSVFPCFRASADAEEAVVSALRSAHYNCYGPLGGILHARRSVADYLSWNLPYKLSPEDVFLTAGCSQSIQTAVSVLARPGVNILLPRPGYRFYEAHAAFSGIEVRQYPLIPQKRWEVDLDVVESLADENTTAIVLINPGNPCGNVFTRQHLAKVAETAKKLRILVIADEVYGHLTFGDNPFVPMGVFGSVVPVLTLGSLSKRWMVPGWRCGWLATCDPNGILKQTEIVNCIKSYDSLSVDPPTFFQGALPDILGKTKGDFFEKTINMLRQAADICFDRTREICGITCPCKPQGSMYFMVKLDFTILPDILDDVEFCCKLAKEESLIICPGSAVGLKDWLRITTAVEPSSLEEGLQRLKSFCQRHAKEK